jgi:hypothetical protein
VAAAAEVAEEAGAALAAAAASQVGAAGQAADTAAALDRVVGAEAIGAPPSVNHDRRPDQPINHPLGPVVDRRVPAVLQEAHLAQVDRQLALQEQPDQPSAGLEQAVQESGCPALADRELGHRV